jgi:hypothetical protein
LIDGEEKRGALNIERRTPNIERRKKELLMEMRAKVDGPVRKALGNEQVRDTRSDSVEKALRIAGKGPSHQAAIRQAFY